MNVHPFYCHLLAMCNLFCAYYFSTFVAENTLIVATLHHWFIIIAFKHRSDFLGCISLSGHSIIDIIIFCLLTREDRESEPELCNSERRRGRLSIVIPAREVTTLVN